MTNTNLKKIIGINVIFIFLVSFVIHNLYDWFPSTITFMFFPINESIWEHQKMIFMAYLVWGIAEYFILKKYNLHTENIMFSTVASAMFNIIIFLLIYTPIYIVFGHNLLVTLLIYLATIILSQFLNYNILKSNKNYKNLNILSLVLMLIMWAIFVYLSYNPLLYKPLFYDADSDTYGVEKGH